MPLALVHFLTADIEALRELLVLFVLVAVLVADLAAVGRALAEVYGDLSVHHNYISY